MTGISLRAVQDVESQYYKADMPRKARAALLLQKEVADTIDDRDEPVEAKKRENKTNAAPELGQSKPRRPRQQPVKRCRHCPVEAALQN